MCEENQQEHRCLVQGWLFYDNEEFYDVNFSFLPVPVPGAEVPDMSGPADGHHDDCGVSTQILQRVHCHRPQGR